MSSYKRDSGVVVVQGRSSRPVSALSTESAASRSSGYSTSSSSSHGSSTDYPSSSSSHTGGHSTYNEKYRSGSSCEYTLLSFIRLGPNANNAATAGYYASVKEVKTRNGSGIVLIQHNSPNTATNEPRADDAHRRSRY